MNMLEIEVELVSGKGKSVVYKRMSEGATLQDLLATFSSKYMPSKGISGNDDQGADYEIVALINSKYPSNGSSTRLRHKDKVTLVPLVFGG